MPWDRGGNSVFCGVFVKPVLPLGSVCLALAFLDVDAEPQMEAVYANLTVHSPSSWAVSIGH